MTLMVINRTGANPTYNDLTLGARTIAASARICHPTRTSTTSA